MGPEVRQVTTVRCGAGLSSQVRQGVGWVRVDA